MLPILNFSGKNLFLLKLSIFAYFLPQSFAAEGEGADHDFFRHEVRTCRFQCGNDASEIIDRENFYKETLSTMDKVRDNVGQITAKTDVTPESTKLNIACFAFEFFDQSGAPILFPFFFGHPEACDENENENGDDVSKIAAMKKMLESPFHFISGRLDKTTIEEATRNGVIQENSLTFLPNPPTSLFYEYRDAYTKLAYKHEKLKSFFNHPIEFQSKNDHEKALKAAFDVSEMEKSWVKSCHERRKQKFEDNERYLCTLLRIETETLRESVFIIKSSEKNRLSDEDIFQHSEQLALARMREKKLAGFIRFVKRFMKSQATPVETSSIGSIVLHVFSRNTLCARCSSSIVLDFSRQFRTEIIQTLFDRVQNIPFYIIAATKLPCVTQPREKEGLNKSVYKKIHDHPATENTPLKLYAGLQDGTSIYQFCLDTAQKQAVSNYAVERAEGKAEGKAEGEKAKAIEIARNLKSMNLSIEQIRAATGLAVDEIKTIK